MLKIVPDAEGPARIGPVIHPIDDARAALQMIREAVEMFGRPGALPSREQTGAHLTDEAEAIVRAITEIAIERDTLRGAIEPSPSDHPPRPFSCRERRRDHRTDQR